MLKLKTIEEETADCHKAFEDIEVGALVFHCHHNRLIEILIEAAEVRISYILSEKDRSERALRLRLFRPIPDTSIKACADWQKACADWRKADADWQKADADWWKWDADWWKADANWWKWDADWWKADADRRKADDADTRKADADRWKAHADWQKADAELGKLIHPLLCPDCPWNGTTIFA